MDNLINRRKFITQSSKAFTVMGILPIQSCQIQDSMKRIGMATVMVRTRIESTSPDWATPDMTLLEVPEYFQDRFGIFNVDLWSRHFEETTPAYLQEVKNQLKKSKSILINVQIDDKYDISNINESMRIESIGVVERWIDIAAELGSRAVRVNAGKGDLDISIKSYKHLNLYAYDRGVIMQCENHFGVESDPENHLKIMEGVNHGNFYTLPDFGNYPEETDRYEALKKIMPYAYQVSAKMKEFDKNGKHRSYDFDRCMEIAESSGFEGVYTVEQYGGNVQHLDFESVGDLIIEKIKKSLDH